MREYIVLPGKERMEISVVVPTFNRRAIVLRAVEALFAQSLPATDFEIIVVVDGSIDGTAAALRLLRPPCQFSVIEQENKGPSAARNTGYRAAAANLVLFLDDDMLSDPGLVAAHLAEHKQRDRIVAFGSLYLSLDSPPSIAAECFNREIGSLYLERKRNSEREWQIADCVFSNASLARSMLEEVGGFDETFRKREDLELGVRLLDSGAQMRYIENAVAYQYFEKTAADLIHDAEAFAVADVMFARRHPTAFIKGQLNWLDQEPRWKRNIRQMAATVPLISDLLLTPIHAGAEICSGVPGFRDIGVRALQIRRRIHWYRKALELGWN